MAISREELELFYGQVEKPIHNFALRWTWNRALAQDLVHEAFVRVWKRRDRVDVETLKGLLYKTVQNLALNELRRRRVREAAPWLAPLLGINGGRDVEQELIEQQDLGRLRAALDALPGELRECILLCQYSDLTYDEIGATLGIPAGTVGSRRNRAIKILEEAMK